MFGSTANRLALKCSDIDMLVIEPNAKLEDLFNDTAIALAKSNKFEFISPIPDAKVPLIRILHTNTRINFDIVFNQENGVKGLSMVVELL